MNQSVPEWQFDETVAVGVDYGDAAVAGNYDSQHMKFRDYEAQAAAIIECVGLTPEQTVLDMGCGTGAMAIPLARYCRHVYAADVSGAMLEVVRGKMKKEGLQNITCKRGGFLTYHHEVDPVDAVVSIAVLHHLPDFWKWVALRRIGLMVKPGGRFYLADVVFPSGMTEHARDLDNMVEGHRREAGEQMGREAAVHLRDEFSTFDWILERFLSEAGFRVDHRRKIHELFTEFLCTRI